MIGATVLEARDLAKYYSISRGAFAKPAVLRALDDDGRFLARAWFRIAVSGQGWQGGSQTSAD